jgi:hypothetical protein
MGVREGILNMTEDYIRCDECGIPLAISEELDWGNNGVITPIGSPRGRMVFYESAIIDNLFQGIEELIRAPIEHIIIESRRREAKKFMEKQFPLETRKAIWETLRRIDEGDGISDEEIMQLYNNRDNLSAGALRSFSVHGHGKPDYGDAWTPDMRHPWRSCYVHNPYSLPFWAAENLASVEVIDGIDEWIEYEKVGEATYKATVYPSHHPVRLKDRLKSKHYEYKPGDLELERCSSCGLPLKIARYVWDAGRGTIVDPDNGRRMAAYSPFPLEAVLDDLEVELGDEIPEVAIEAQRRFVKSRTSMDNWRRSDTAFTYFSALRGLGNLTRFEVDEHKLELTLQNSCLPLITIGTVKAIYELALGHDKTSHEWSRADDGDLNITIKAR